MESRSLTIEEATSRLPLVRVIVKDAMAVKAGLARRQLEVLKHETAGETENAVLLEEVIEDEEIRLDELHEELLDVPDWLKAADRPYTLTVVSISRKPPPD